jgi:hypothetical protein
MASRMGEVFDPFMLGPSVAGLAVNIFAVERAVRGERDAEAADVPATRESVAAHLPFQESAVAVLYRLGYLSNFRLAPPLRIPPAMLGTLWNLPVVYRTLRELPELVEELQQDFVTAATVGPASLFDPMASVLTAVGEACMAFANRGQARKPTFDERCEAAYQQLAQYSRAVRERLAGALP